MAVKQVASRLRIIPRVDRLYDGNCKESGVAQVRSKHDPVLLKPVSQSNAMLS
jgi:hypothetical protein